MPSVSVIPDEEAVLLSRLIDRYYTDVFSYLYHLVGERNLAQDLAHQVFLPPHSDRVRLAHAATPKAWLFRRATTLACAESVDCHSRRSWLAWRAEPQTSSAKAPLEALWGQPSPLEAALAALSFRHRAALLLYGHYHLSLAETSVVLRARPTQVVRDIDAAFQAVAGTYQKREEGQAVQDAHVEVDTRFSIEDDLARMPDAWASRRAQERLYAGVKSPVEDARVAARPSPFAPGVAVLALIAVFIVAGAWLGGQVRLAPAVSADGRHALATSPASPTTTAGALDPPALASQISITEVLPAGMSAADAAWLRQNAIPLITTQPGNSSPADLLRLKPVIGNARIVALADSSYGTQELNGLKQRIVESLVDQMNFNTVVVDSAWPQAELLNDFLQTGRGDPERLALLLTGGYRQSPDLLKTVEWLRSHNQDPLGVPKVAFHGFDVLQAYSHIPLDVVVPYLEKVDPEAVTVARGNNEDLYRYILAHRSDYLSQSTFGEFNVALRNARALAQYDAVAAADPASHTLLRDQFMTENVLSMLRGFGGGNRLILWGQASDLGVDSQTGNLGAILRQRFGQNYVVIYLDFYEGSLSASSVRPGKASGPIEIHRVGPPPAGSYEDFLHLAGLPLFMLDLRPARPAGEAQTVPINGLNSRVQPYLYRGGTGGYPGPVPYGGNGTPGPLSRFDQGSGVNSGGGSGALTTPAPPSAGPDSYRPSYATPEALLGSPTVATPGEPMTGTVWLQGPHLTRSIQGGYDDCVPEAQFTSVRLAESFDAVIFVNTVSPASTLFQTTGPAHPTCPGTATPAP